MKQYEVIFYGRGKFPLQKRSADTMEKAEEIASEFMRKNGFAYSCEIWIHILLKEITKEAMS